MKTTFGGKSFEVELRKKSRAFRKISVLFVPTLEDSLESHVGVL